MIAHSLIPACVVPFGSELSFYHWRLFTFPVSATTSAPFFKICRRLSTNWRSSSQEKWITSGERYFVRLHEDLNCRLLMLSLLEIEMQANPCYCAALNPLHRVWSCCRRPKVATRLLPKAMPHRIPGIMSWIQPMQQRQVRLMMLKFGICVFSTCR